MNAMPVFKFRTFLGALVFFVTACVPQIEIVFYNHSGKDLTISGSKTAHQVRKDDVVTIPIYELGPTFHITDGLNDWDKNKVSGTISRRVAGSFREGSFVKRISFKHIPI
jgi:hypothetical protein